MSVNISPTEPLSQVIFVHDYVQRIFQGAQFEKRIEQRTLRKAGAPAPAPAAAAGDEASRTKM